MAFDNHTEYSLHLQSCLRDHASVWQQPWEIGLVSQPAKRKLVPRGPLPLCELEKPESAEGSELFSKSSGLVKIAEKMARFSKYDSNPKAWIDLQSEERSLAVAKWQRIILVEPLAFGLARDFHASKAAGLGTGPFLNSVADALAVKATSTLHSRANALMRYVAWASGKTAIVFPAAEPLVYAYFDDAKDKAAPTSLKSVLSAFAFAKYVVGLKGVDEILESGRVRGLAARLFLQKRKLLQRNPLKVEHVALLERICCGLEGRSLQDRMAAGFFLFLVHARARFSDAQRVCKLLFVRLISAYLEVHVSRSKTSYSLERKVRFLPMAACALGLSGLRWADAWIDVMEECGIRIHEDLPLLPCPGSNGTWRNVPLPCDQACVWLRSLLAQGVGPDEYLNNVGTHSCKRTILSWASKRGLPRDQRAILGYHTSKSAGVGTELIYEVDAQSAPLRAMASMLREVRSGKFMPDNPRGQQLAEECERSDEEDPPHSEDDMASSSGSSVDEEERDHSEDEQAVARTMERWPGRVDERRLPGDARYFRHRQSRVIHLTADEAGAHLICGRALSVQYGRCHERPAVLHPRCKQCFRAYVA